MNDYKAPCGYCAPIAAMRAAEAKPLTPSEQFEVRWQNMRARGFELERRAAANAEAMRTLGVDTRDDNASAPAPDGYAAGLAAMRAAALKVQR